MMIEINLLPKEYKRRGNVLSFDKKVLYLGSAAAAIVLVLGALTLYQQHQAGQLDRLIIKARAEENRYKKDIAIIDALTEVKGKILARVDAIEKLDHRRNFYINMLEDLDSRLPEYLWMTGFTETPGGPPPQGTNEPGKSQPGNQAAAAQAASKDKDSVQTNPGVGTAAIEGYAFSLNAIGTFIISMMKSDFFHNVKLERAKAEDVGTVTAYNFKLTCQINYDAHMATDEYENTDEGPHISSTHGHKNQDIDRNDPDNLFEQR